MKKFIETFLIICQTHHLNKENQLLKNTLLCNVQLPYRVSYVLNHKKKEICLKSYKTLSTVL